LFMWRIMSFLLDFVNPYVGFLNFLKFFNVIMNMFLNFFRIANLSLDAYIKKDAALYLHLFNTFNTFNAMPRRALLPPY
jgi:hypothetical protein